MKLVVLSCGRVGSDVARLVAASGGFDEMLVADIDAESATALASELDVQMAQFDARDPESLAKLLRGADVVFNAVGPFHRFALSIVDAAVEAGAHYVDINDDFDVAEALMTDDRLDAAAKEAGITVLTGAGSAPGLTNLMARWAVSELDRAEPIHVVMGLPFIVNLGPTILEHMFHSLTGEVTQYVDGEYRKVPAWGDPRRFDLLPPFGSYEFGYFGHSEALTLPKFVPGLREVTTRFAWFQAAGNDIYRRLGDWGLLGAETSDNLPMPPRRFLADFMGSALGEKAMSVDVSGAPLGAVFHVAVEGELQGGAATVVLECHQMLADETPAGDHLTAICAARAVGEILAGRITATGVVAPEACIDPEPFVNAALAQMGARLHRRMTSSRQLL